MDFRGLGHTCVVGLQWGDEGKGKVVDMLVEHFDVVARYAGGANAGHTVVADNEKFALHQLPSGILRKNALSLITCGTVIDPAVLLGEIVSLRERGVEIGDNLRISDRAHLVFPWHRRQDILAERDARPGAKLGTTARGIGPCYADKAARHWAVRVCDLYRPDWLRERLAAIAAHKNAYFAAVYDEREPIDAGAITDEYLQFAEQLRPFVCDTTLLLHELMAQAKRVLFEGAQGCLLDIDHGTYPYVTSSTTIAGGMAGGAGVPPTTVRSIIGVVKAYTTRVGAGPFPTELRGAVGDTIRERGGEYGTTTSRPRRCGWFDAIAAARSAMIGGPTHLAVMHVDTLAGLDELKVCVGYRIGGEITNSFPAGTYDLEKVEPVYETLPGWKEELGDCRRWQDLPPAARTYLDLLSERLSTPVRFVGVGPGREQTIYAGGGS